MRLITLCLLLCLSIAGCASEPGLYDYQIKCNYAVTDPQFRRVINNLLGPPLAPGNNIVGLNNGDEIFPAMLKAIAAAKKTITFETYVYWSGTVGEMFATALAERAKAGVKVHVLIDAVGAMQIDEQYVARMLDGGVKVVFYHPLRWFDIGSAVKLNNRTHRKLLIVDGTVGFTGGVGIADEWLGHAQDAHHWRDTHYCVEGPVVAQMQSAFLDNWMEVTGEVLISEDYYPPLEEAGAQTAQMFQSSSNGGSESMHLMFLLSMSAAQKSIRIASAYFVPDDLTEKTMLEARKRNVRVQIVVPGPVTDAEIVQQASRARWGDLLKAGVEIYQYQPTLYHTKLMIVDEFWTSIGSSNMDNRSFSLNDEANLNVLDAEFAAKQREIFEDDLTHSRQVTYDEWANRPLGEKVMENIASLFGPQL